MSLYRVLFVLTAIPSVCSGQNENSCNVGPKDQYILVGSDTDVVCQTSCVHGRIYWTLNNTSVDESLSTAFNSSHTVLSLRNFTHHSATLQCQSVASRQVLGGTTIRTYTKPGRISCILHHSNQLDESLPDLFTCKWEHRMNTPLAINYSVLGAYGSQLSQREICKSHITECKASSDPIKLLENITITIRAKTAAWEVDSDPQEFSPLHILKMIRPQLSVTTFSDHLSVEWKRASRSKECHCQVKYGELVNMTLKEGDGSLSIWNLESCRNYTFSVRCAFDGAPWSDWSEEKTVLTKMNESDVQLRLWRNVAEPEESGVRKVHAMWTEIPPTCGDTFTYTVKPYTRDGMEVNDTAALCRGSTCDLYVNRDAHTIHLTVFHNETLLSEYSVYIPAAGESLPGVTDMETSTLKGVILVSWKAPIQPVSGYMIDWSHGGNQYYWKESKYTNATLSDLLDKKPYNITVTPLFGNKTGHGTQALQICSGVGDPGNVTITQVEPNDKSALVSWNVKSEGACSGAVVNYTIFYGIQEGPQLNVTVDGTVQSLLLKDLNPDTNYVVYVEATALSGTTRSLERHVKTKRFDPGLITAVSISGSIIILLVLFLGLCCAIKWKNFKEKPVPNPGLSSAVLWPAASHHERVYPIQPFNPSESLCDRVYTEDTHTSTTLLTAGCDGNPASDQTDEYIDPDTFPAPDVQCEHPVKPVETQHLSSPDDSTALLPLENSPLSPYRSQASDEISASRSSKHCKRVSVKQPEKAAPVTVYVTLDMFEQGQGR